MSELRLSVATGEWVIFAPERARRPEDFQSDKPDWTHSRPTWKGNCPFCPGNEVRTPGETLSFGDEQSGWLVRSFPNRFPAVFPGPPPKMQGPEFLRSLQGVGRHEVVAESPRHNQTLGLMTRSEVGLVLRAWRRRYRFLWLQPETEHVVIFKNHGHSAGCSLEHPHSQIVALPVIPHQILQRHEVASRYYSQHGGCVFCAQLEMELQQNQRILAQSDEFVAFIPYAAFSPFSIWVVPRKHRCSFAQSTDSQLDELALLLRQLLARLYHVLGDPDYNLVVRSSHPEMQGSRIFHWYLTLVPRLSKAAGFELGTGMFINPSSPEADAEFLMTASIPEGPPDMPLPALQRVQQSQRTVAVVDLENHVLSHAPRSVMRKENLLHRAVKILIYNQRGEILVHRRTSTKDLFASMHDLFVGGVVESEESYDEAAVRVLANELGIQGQIPQLVCRHLYLGARSRAWIQIYRLIWGGPLQFHPDHIEWSAWLPESELDAWTTRTAVVPMGLDCLFAYQDWKSATGPKPQNG